MSNKNNKPEPDSINYLFHLVQSAEEKGEQLSREGKKLDETGQNFADFARSVKPLLQYTPPGNLESIINDFEVANKSFDFALAHLSAINPVAIDSTSGTATVSVSGVFTPANILPWVPTSEQHTAEKALVRLWNVLNVAADEDDVVALMKSLGLNRAPKGQKNPLSQFVTAHQAFKTPVTPDNPISTSLLPMRESIRLTIGHILKKRPYQEEAKTEIAKVTSIGRQFAYDTISPDTIDSWAQQWNELLKQLSAAKEKDNTREEWQDRLTQATLWLKAFLSGLDPNKVNRKTHRPKPRH